MSDNLPALPEKPGLLDYLEQFLPFKLPRIPFAQTARNLDKAAARLIDAGSINLAARIAAHTARTRNRSHAEGEFIEAGSKAAVDLVTGADPELAERAIEYALGDAVTGQRNRETILQIAAEELSSDPPASDAEKEIDEDWLNMFSDLAAQKSSADIQTLWGKILAGEIRAPGTFTLRTLLRLATITSDEANFIHRFMDLVIDGRWIYVGPVEGAFLSTENALRLQDLDAISDVGGLLRRQANLKANRPHHFILRDLAVKVECETDQTVFVENTFSLTSFGEQLFKLSGDMKGNRPLADTLARSFLASGRKVHVLELGLRLPNGHFPVLSQTEIEKK